MQDKQPEALRMADALDDGPHSMEIEHQAAATLRAQHAELQQWKNVFGHLGTADECGNEWIRLQDSIKSKDALLRKAVETLTLHQGAHPETYRQARDAITKELSQ